MHGEAHRPWFSNMRVEASCMHCAVCVCLSQPMSCARSDLGLAVFAASLEAFLRKMDVMKFVL